jgi:hypothetical protein
MNFDRVNALQPFPGTVGSVFVSQMLGHDGRQRNYRDVVKVPADVDININIPLDGAAYQKALDSAGMVSSAGSKSAKDAMFPMLTPDRAFADNLVIEELVMRGILDSKLVWDLLITDFTTPSYSASRCALAESAPLKENTPAGIRKAWAANLATSKLEGAAELKDRLEKADSSVAINALQTYLQACRTRAENDSATFMEDVLRIVAQRRLEFRTQFRPVVESDALLPQAKSWDVKPNELRLDPTDCTLKKR